MNDGAFSRRIAVTGGAGFIGSNYLLRVVPQYPQNLFVNIDCLTYAGNLSNLKEIESAPNYRFEKIDICEREALENCFKRYDFTAVIHLAAETHVDRSILGPSPFVNTNIVGTFNLLELARQIANCHDEFRFHHVSTDEVFGPAAAGESFDESHPYRPSSPYAASKAAADHVVQSFHVTYGLDTVISNCSNNYGPYQFPEKLIPLVIHNALVGSPIPVYGDGFQERNWLFVEDHCAALDAVFRHGRTGATYNVGGDYSVRNIELVQRICEVMDGLLGGPSRERLITFVKDRPGHDRRYAINAAKTRQELGWKAKHSLDDGLSKTVQWYLENKKWLDTCTSGEYRKYYERIYSNR
jgi:dTDP-glucose 4,6-dehydratase